MPLCLQDQMRVFQEEGAALIVAKQCLKGLGVDQQEQG